MSKFPNFQYIFFIFFHFLGKKFVFLLQISQFKVKIVDFLLKTSVFRWNKCQNSCFQVKISVIKWKFPSLGKNLLFRQKKLFKLFKLFFLPQISQYKVKKSWFSVKSSKIFSIRWNKCQNSCFQVKISVIKWKFPSFQYTKNWPMH